MPTVSVITPTYNRADVLPRAIESVRRQTFRDYEHIVVNDGSTDDTPAVVAEYDDDRIEYVDLPNNCGAAAARNRGLERVRGEYVTFLDSDDAYHPDRLAITTTALDAQPDHVAGVFHPLVKVSGDNESVRKTPTGEITLDELVTANVICGLPNSAYRSRACDAVGGFDESLAYAEDYDLQLRLLREFTMVGIDEALVRCYGDVEGLSNDPLKVRQGLTSLLNKHREMLSDRNIADRHRRIGATYLRTGDEETARDHFEKAVDLWRDSYDRSVYELIGRTCLEVGHRPLARRYLCAALRRNPLAYRSYVLLLATFAPVEGQGAVTTLKSTRDGIISNIKI
ncbi:glycosyltransferase family 2 protein [Halobacteriales archaeon QH_10_67_22]|nr:MAG: glycosyltransferase family 2 protein [Halobacteriales archaeon QH_10_67_22]